MEVQRVGANWEGLSLLFGHKFEHFWPHFEHFSDSFQTLFAEQTCGRSSSVSIKSKNGLSVGVRCAVFGRTRLCLVRPRVSLAQASRFEWEKAAKSGKKWQKWKETLHCIVSPGASLWRSYRAKGALFSLLRSS